MRDGPGRAGPAGPADSDSRSIIIIDCVPHAEFVFLHVSILRDCVGVITARISESVVVCCGPVDGGPRQSPVVDPMKR